jgi:hypothetical protein
MVFASERDARKKLRQNLPLASLSTLNTIRDMYPSPWASNGTFGHQFDRVNAVISGTPPTPNVDDRMDIQL